MLRLLPIVPFLLAMLPVEAPADVGATLSLQSDARERGVSYSADRPAAQLGVVWDGAGGWYAGATLAQVRFGTGRRSGWLRGYAGRVVTLYPGLDAEVGVVAHHFESVSHYDHVEPYAGLLGEHWQLRLHHARDHYGSGQRATYVEVNGRWPLLGRMSAIGHAGVLRSAGQSRWSSQGGSASQPPARLDLRAGASWQLGEHGELQLAWLRVSRGGPVMWSAPSRRHAIVLCLNLAL